jgi:hypothetical protein
MRTWTSFTYQAGSWTRPRKVVARLECSLQPDTGDSVTTSNGMRQEVDIRYVVTSLEGSAEHLYEEVYCERGQMENLIKLHKAQLSSDRMSCHSATANSGAARVLYRCILANALRARLHSEDRTAREGRVHNPPRTAVQDRRAHYRACRTHPHPVADQFPGSAFIPCNCASPRTVVHRMSHGALCSDARPSEADQPQTRCTVSCATAQRSGRTDRWRARGART